METSHGVTKKIFVKTLLGKLSPQRLNAVQEIWDGLSQGTQSVSFSYLVSAYQPGNSLFVTKGFRSEQVEREDFETTFCSPFLNVEEGNVTRNEFVNYNSMYSAGIADTNTFVNQLKLVWNQSPFSPAFVRRPLSSLSSTPGEDALESAKTNKRRNEESQIFGSPSTEQRSPQSSLSSTRNVQNDPLQSPQRLARSPQDKQTTPQRTPQINLPPFPSNVRESPSSYPNTVTPQQRPPPQPHAIVEEPLDLDLIREELIHAFKQKGREAMNVLLHCLPSPLITRADFVSAFEFVLGGCSQPRSAVSQPSSLSSLFSSLLMMQSPSSSTHLSLPTLLNFLSPPSSNLHLSATAAFASLASQMDASPRHSPPSPTIPLHHFRRCFSGERHPAVLSGEMTKAAVESEFVLSFLPAHFAPSGVVTSQSFVLFCQAFSLFTDDLTLCSMLPQIFTRQQFPSSDYRQTATPQSYRSATSYPASSPLNSNLISPNQFLSPQQFSPDRHILDQPPPYEHSYHTETTPSSSNDQASVGSMRKSVELISQIRPSFAASGVYSLCWFEYECKKACEEKAGRSVAEDEMELMFSELQQILALCNVSIREPLFHTLCLAHSTSLQHSDTIQHHFSFSVSLPSLFEALRQPLSQTRQESCVAMFNSIDREHKGHVGLPTLLASLNVKDVEEVRKGRISREDFCEMVLSNMDTTRRICTLSHFLGFCSKVSTCVEDDATFQLTLWSSWKLPKKRRQ